MSSSIPLESFMYFPSKKGQPRTVVRSVVFINHHDNRYPKMKIFLCFCDLRVINDASSRWKNEPGLQLRSTIVLKYLFSRLSKILNHKFSEIMSEVVVEKLSQLMAEDDPFPDCIYLFGQKSVGKSLCLKKFFDKSRSWLNSVVVHTAECYTSKILFETIINAFRGHEPSEDNDYSSFGRLDSIEDFLMELRDLDQEKSYVIAVEEAERLRDMEFNLLPVLIKLQQYTNLNIACVLVSHLAFEKIDASAAVIQMHVPDHTKADIISILAQNYDGIKDKITRGIEKSTELREDEKKKQLAIVEKLDVEFYKQFLNAFLNVFFKACRDITELRSISNKCFVSYYTPVLREEIAHTDVTNLWRNISKVLRAALQTGHMRIGNLSAVEMDQKLSEDSSIEPVKENSLRKFAQTLELPYYAKFLLLASFLASHNDPKFDKRLFMKHHGKERKRQLKAKVNIIIHLDFN